MLNSKKGSPSHTNKTQFNKRKGHEVEHLVAEYLQQQGLHLIQRNFSCRMGEIDLILLHQNTLIFVEVRFRRLSSYGSAADSVNFVKQQKIIKSARLYLLKNPAYADLACRFDVVAVTLHQGQMQMEWVQNAFA